MWPETDNPETDAASQPAEIASNFPLLPAGTLLWSGVAASEIDFNSLTHTGAIILAATSTSANGVALVVNGGVMDGFLLDQAGPQLGPEIARQLIALPDASFSATVTDQNLVDHLSILWRNLPMSTDLDKRWIEVYGLMESVGESGDDRLVTVESGTSRGVVIFSKGFAAAAYTSIDRRPTVAYQVVLPLFHDGKQGTVNIFSRSPHTPGPSLPVSQLVDSRPSPAPPGEMVWSASPTPVPPPPPQPQLQPQVPVLQPPQFQPPPQLQSLQPHIQPQPLPADGLPGAIAPPLPPSVSEATEPPASGGRDWITNVADEKESWPALFDRSAAPLQAQPQSGLLAKRMAQGISQQSPSNQLRFGFMVSQLLALSRKELGVASPVVEQVINSSEPSIEGLSTAIATVNALVPPGCTREQMADLVATMRVIVNEAPH